MNRRQEFAAVFVLAVVGAALFGVAYPTFPSAGVSLEHTRADARATAGEFVSDLGYDVSGYSVGAGFGSDGETSVYLQRTLPAERASGAMAEYSVQRWEVRFFKPLEGEQFIVRVDPETGEVVGFEHVVPDDASGEALSRAEARALAEGFLRERGHDLGSYEPVKNASTDRPNRRDHTFVWRHESRGVGDAPYEVRVEVHGGRIGAYERGLNVPDSFTHDYQVQQSRSLLPTVGFLLLSVAFGVAAIYYGLRYYKRETFQTRYGLALGGTVAVLSLVASVNGLPGVRTAIPSTLDPGAFYAIVAVIAVFAAGLLGAITLIAAGTGARLAAEVLDRAPVTRLEGLREREQRRRVAASSARGFLLAFVLLGIYGLFYLAGTAYFDVWLPATPATAQAATTAVPALVALTTAGTAAVWEEVAYRLFAIPLCKRYLEYTAAAVVVPAFVWGLGHSGYAVLPYYTRIVETTLLGIVLGYAFLRWDVVTTVAAHFTLNATVVTLALLSAGSAFLLDAAGGALVALLPLLAAAGLLVYDRRRPDTPDRGSPAGTDAADAGPDDDAGRDAPADADADGSDG